MKGMLHVSDVERAHDVARSTTNSNIPHKDLASGEEEAEEEVDNGGMTMNEVYIAVARGELSEDRKAELKRRFRLLMRVVLGEE